MSARIPDTMLLSDLLKATGLTAGTGSYTKETDTVTVSTDSYARYADGDFQI